MPERHAIKGPGGRIVVSYRCQLVQVMIREGEDGIWLSVVSPDSVRIVREGPTLDEMVGERTNPLSRRVLIRFVDEAGQGLARALVRVTPTGKGKRHTISVRSPRAVRVGLGEAIIAGMLSAA